MPATHPPSRPPLPPPPAQAPQAPERAVQTVTGPVQTMSNHDVFASSAGPVAAAKAGSAALAAFIARHGLPALDDPVPTGNTARQGASKSRPFRVSGVARDGRRQAA